MNKIKYLIFPGRHLAFTTIQERLLQNQIQKNPNATLVFAVSSANQEDCRYNPLPITARSVQIDRFAQTLGIKNWRIVAIPHFGPMPTKQYCTRTQKTIENNLNTQLTNENSKILVSTYALAQAWRALKFEVFEMENEGHLGNQQIFPIDIISCLGKTGGYHWATHPMTRAFFEDYSQFKDSLQRIWNDPLFNDNGDLAEGRNYQSYTAGMHQNILLKAKAIQPHIVAGRISDEGCADGSLLEELAKSSPESDLIGVDGSAEMVARAKEKIRMGCFGHTFAHFYCLNIMQQIFEPNSIDTTISNSTLHEIYSYNGYSTQAVKDYLAEKFKQTRPGGVFVARDVVGPKQRERIVTLEVKGVIEPDSVPIEETSLATRAHRMYRAMDVKPGEKQTASKWTQFQNISLGDAMEFLHKMDYTDNWNVEVSERFCFWDHEEWKKALTEVGFEILPQSKCFPEAWLYENRITNDRAFIQTPRGIASYPDTHQILVAQKPMH